MKIDRKRMTFNEKLKIWIYVIKNHSYQKSMRYNLRHSTILKNEQEIIEKVTSVKGKRRKNRNNANTSHLFKISKN